MGKSRFREDFALRQMFPDPSIRLLHAGDTAQVGFTIEEDYTPRIQATIPGSLFNHDDIRRGAGPARLPSREQQVTCGGFPAGRDLCLASTRNALLRIRPLEFFVMTVTASQTTHRQPRHQCPFRPSVLFGGTVQTRGATTIKARQSLR